MKTIELATGTDPQGALAKFMAGLKLTPGVYAAGIAHDDGCPCVDDGASMAGCTCEIVEIAMGEFIL